MESLPGGAELNDAQREAMTYAGGHLLITAGPGTGKTFTLTGRIARTVSHLKASQKILAVTFTNKAAEEMRDRLASRWQCPARAAHVNTFHGFALHLLHRYAERTAVPKGFQVVSPEDVREKLRAACPGRPVREIQEILEEAGRWKSQYPLTSPPEKVLAYQQFLKENALLDFDDLFREILIVLHSQHEILRDVRKTFPFIFVDEYQDINAIQRAFLKILAGDDGQVTAIGDPHQAIYGFRGSDARFFENFSGDFSGAKILSLKENYRSAARLVTASSQIMPRDDDGMLPAVIAAIYREGHLIVHESPTGRAEAEYVVHQIERLIGGTSLFSLDSRRVTTDDRPRCGFGDIAVLYRLHHQNKLLEEAFFRSGIPYQMSGHKAAPSLDDAFERGADKVSLLTLHAAKGLEFAVVFIVGCEERLIPLRLGDLAGDPGEERRLFYVGMTRAKERLYLVRARKRALFGERYETLPSPFLSDIEEALKSYDHGDLKRRERPEKKEAKQLTMFDM